MQVKVGGNRSKGTKHCTKNCRITHVKSCIKRRLGRRIKKEKESAKEKDRKMHPG